MGIDAGFLVVKTFERVYLEYQSYVKDYEPHLLDKPIYSRPRRAAPLQQVKKRYRGIDRDPIQPWDDRLRGSGVEEPTEQELAASVFMADLMRSGREHDDFILDVKDAVRLLEMIAPPVEREIIWARRMDRDVVPPPGTVLWGYEPTEFYPSNHESLVRFCLFFPGRDTPDLEGPGFETYDAMLNQWGLFNTPSLAQEFYDLSISNARRLGVRPDEGFYITEVRGMTH